MPKNDVPFRITRDALESYVRMVANATGSTYEATWECLYLYYQIRRACETCEQKNPEAKQKPEPKQEPAPKRTGELSPTAKAAAFKRKTRERMTEMIYNKQFSYPKLADASGVDEVDLMRIVDGRPVKVEAYKRIAEALDKVGAQPVTD